MATRDEDKALLDESLEILARDEVEAEDLAVFEQLAEHIEAPGLQDAILERYESFGRTLLSDSLPSHVDPRVSKHLEPFLGDVSDVRVHTGPVASQAAQAMEARAFAIGDRDIFVDRTLFDPRSKEGATLLAHEIAHTRDAATGFALSAKHGSSTAAREQYAHEMEHEFATEWEASDAGEAVRDDETPTPNTTHGGMPKEPEVDRVRLAEMILGVFKRQDRWFSDRIGAWHGSD